jgi:hypothetical protein
MFDIVQGRVSNICSGEAVGLHAVEGAGEMELMIKVVLVGYVLYAVLGAPMVTARREHA